MARANSIISCIIERLTGRRPILKFTVKNVGELKLDMGKLHPDVLEYAAAHGLKQRIADAAAQSRDEETGASASPEAKFAAMKRLVDHYESGAAEWGLRVGGGGGSEGGLTLRALARVQGITVDEARERVERIAEKRESTSRAVLAKLAKSPDVVKAMNAIRAEEATGGEDADTLLDEFMGDE